MIKALVFIAIVILTIVFIHRRKRGTLFSQATDNAKRQKRKLMRKTMSLIKEEVNKSVKDGNLEVNIKIGYGDYRKIELDVLEDALNKQYSGEVKLKNFGEGWGGYSIKLEIVK